MNDNDIIKLFKVCSTASGCKDCRFADSTDCAGEVSAMALDLINRLKAEIEKYEKEHNEKFNKWMVLDKRTKERYAELYEEAKGVVRAEAIKEFAEKIKGIDLYQCVEEYYKNAEFYYDVRRDWFCEYIDSLVKEMTEGKDGNV